MPSHPTRPASELVIAPPRLLTGIAWCLWGVVLGAPLIGIGAALLTEFALFRTRTRLDFSEVAYVKAWRLGLFAFVLTIAVQLLLGTRLINLYGLIRWLPLFLLPVDLVMRYGVRKTIPANTFAYFARRKMLSDRAAGQETDTLMCHTGYIMIALLLLCTSQAASPLDRWLLLIGVLCITVASLVFLTRKRHRLVPLFIVVCSAAAGSYYASEGLYDAARKFTRTIHESGSEQNDGTEVRTFIGELGDLKLSQEVMWRVDFNGGKRHLHLSQAHFNHYSYGRWIHRPPLDDEGYQQTVNDDYSVANVPPGSQLFIFDYQQEDEVVGISALPAVTIQGRVGTTTALPIPPRPVAIGGLARNEQEATSLAIEGFLLETNSLGTVRAVNPPSDVIRYNVHYGVDDRSEQAPWDRDLHVPNSNTDTCRAIISQLGLEGLPVREQIQKLQAHFLREFRYTTHLGTSGTGKKRDREDPLNRFLATTRAGHCEYFATATTLLLRSLGIPARYTIGYAVSERDPKSENWLLRGTHAHAWSRAFVDGEWINIDLTPPSWLAADQAVATPRSAVAEWFQKLTEAFTLWRFRATNDGSLILIFGGALVAIFLYVLFRLRTVRRVRLGKKTAVKTKIEAGREGLIPLFPTFEKLLGPRPSGTSVRRWLDPLTSDLPALAPAISLHSRLRYDPVELEPDVGQQMLALRHDLAKQSSRLLVERLKSQS